MHSMFMAGAMLDRAAVWMQEMAEAEASQPRERRLPRGTSEYQAAWILDEEGNAGDFDNHMESPQGDQGDEAVSEASETEEGDMASMADTGGLLDRSMARLVLLMPPHCAKEAGILEEDWPSFASQHAQHMVRGSGYVSLACAAGFQRFSLAHPIDSYQLPIPCEQGHHVTVI